MASLSSPPIVPPVMSIVLLYAYTPPPEPAEVCSTMFPAMTALSLMLSVPPPSVYTPPPLIFAVLPRTAALPFIVNVPPVWYTPPPLPVPLVLLPVILPPLMMNVPPS